MNDAIASVKLELSKIGYKKKGNSFYKIENDFYKLINFQTGAFGGYFFINICIHPIGLPELNSKHLVIRDRPKEYECIIRQRIEQITTNPKLITAFTSGFVTESDKEVIYEVIASLTSDVEEWINYISQYSTFLKMDENTLSSLLNVVPRYKTKSIYMLKFYSSLKVGNLNEAISFFQKYLNIEVDGASFAEEDRYMKELLEKNAGQGARL
jgi:hypothetical protein